MEVQPATVDLRTVPSVTPETPPLEQRRGRRPIPGPITEEEKEVLRQAALRMEPSENIQVLGELAPPVAQAPNLGSGWESLNFGDDPNAIPPDPEVAVGPGHVIAAVNTAFEIYDKTGSSLTGAIQFETFFSVIPQCTNLFDPNVLYDESADRFFLGIDSNGTAFCIAASQTDDPTGVWNIYRVPTTPGLFFDYPHTGVGEDAFVMGANMFNGGFIQAEVYAMEKADAYAGTTMTVVSQVLPGGSTIDTPQPMNLHGFNQGTWPNTGVHYILSDLNFNGTSIRVWSWTDPFTSNVLGSVGTVDLNTASGVTGGFPLSFPNSGGVALDGNDWRVQDAEYRNGSVWMAHTISCNPGGGTVNCVRWAEIDPTVPSIVQAGVFASTGEYRQFPDLAVNACGDMSIGYTKSSSSIFPGVFATGRLSTDPLGTVGSEATVKAGEVAYQAFGTRWGDYTGMTSDPDGVRTWYLGEYSESSAPTTARWGNYVQEFSTSCSVNEIFADGFESGDVTAWSSPT
ncbi:MAG: hypothetical protein DWQ36_03775, partial [Acidobacteria bacterium]